MIQIILNELLEKRNKSKYWLVKEMEGSYQALTKLMKNETISIHFSTLEKLCNILNCEPRRFNKIKKMRKNKIFE